MWISKKTKYTLEYIINATVNKIANSETSYDIKKYITTAVHSSFNLGVKDGTENGWIYEREKEQEAAQQVDNSKVSAEKSVD